MPRKLATNSDGATKQPASRARRGVSSPSNTAAGGKPVDTNLKAKPRRGPRPQPGKASRQRPQPSSTELSKREVVNVLMALLHAEHIGLVPTHFITIDWALGGVTDGVRATGQFLKLLKDAARSRGWPNCHIWVRETGPVMGDHVHILLHLPPGSARWLAKRKAGWLAKCGAARRKGVSHTRQLVGRPLIPDPFEPVSDLYRANLSSVARYILKHGNPSLSTMFGIKGNGSCTVVGKRVSVSQNLSWKPRAGCDECSQPV